MLQFTIVLLAFTLLPNCAFSHDIAEAKKGHTVVQASPANAEENLKKSMIQLKKLRQADLNFDKLNAIKEISKLQSYPNEVVDELLSIAEKNPLIAHQALLAIAVMPEEKFTQEIVDKLFKYAEEDSRRGYFALVALSRVPKKFFTEQKLDAVANIFRKSNDLKAQQFIICKLLGTGNEARVRVADHLNSKAVRELLEGASTHGDRLIRSTAINYLRAMGKASQDLRKSDTKSE